MYVCGVSHCCRTRRFRSAKSTHHCRRPLHRAPLASLCFSRQAIFLGAFVIHQAFFQTFATTDSKVRAIERIQRIVCSRGTISKSIPADVLSSRRTAPFPRRKQFFSVEEDRLELPPFSRPPSSGPPKASGKGNATPHYRFMTQLRLHLPFHH